MKKITHLLILILILGSQLIHGCSEDDNVTDPGSNNGISSLEGYKLVWNDEFEGTAIDGGKWIHEVNAWGGGNNELQYYTDRPENSYVEDGMLHIVARQGEYTGPDGTRYYTSARMTTQRTRSFMYGRIEARLKLPCGQGLWPAFWMLGINISQIGWPKCGEIDIMEMIGGGAGRDNCTHGTLHWDDNGKRSSGSSYTLPTGILHDNFHIYAIEWDEDKITWYLDDVMFHTVDISAPALEAFHKHHFIILNVAVGGNWPGDPDLSTTWPQEMLVDYVRAYERE